MSTAVQPNPSVQTISFRRPTNQTASTPAKPVKNRHGGLLQDQLRRCVSYSQTVARMLNTRHRAQRAPWCPSWSAALRILLLIRVTGAMYSGIQDCDEGMVHVPPATGSTPQFMCFSLQLLGTITLLVEGLRLPDMGNLAGILNQELGLYPSSLLPSTNICNLHWSRKGQFKNVSILLPY